MDALNGDDTCYPWKIDSICSDSKRLSLAFNCCSFCWVRREANNVALCLANCLLLCTIDLYVVIKALSPLCFRGMVKWCLFCFCFLNENSFSKKKKKKKRIFIRLWVIKIFYVTFCIPFYTPPITIYTCLIFFFFFPFKTWVIL